DELDIERCAAGWPTWPDLERSIGELFPEPELRAKALEETRAKHIDTETLRARLGRLRTEWPALRKSLREQLLPAEELSEMLQEAGAPHLPEQIGISPSRLRDSHRLAYHLRRRYTVLDLAVQTGLLEPH
ncbi:MAG: sn-glycerol-1-phosphate dehydrogenase, partial [Actinomycetota bacterium]